MATFAGKKKEELLFFFLSFLGNNIFFFFFFHCIEKLSNLLQKDPILVYYSHIYLLLIDLIFFINMLKGSR